MKAHYTAGYEPVAKIPGVLSASFLTMDPNIAFPEDMKGKRIGFYEKDAMITALALKDLHNMGIDPAKYFKSVTYYSDSNAVLNAMQYKLIDIGVANSSLFNNWNNRGYNLVLVLQGKGVPHLTFAVRGDLPPATKQAVTQALLKAQQDRDGQDFFKISSFTNFEPAKVSDYDDMVKFLGITK
jgi:phosphonate transport system substrate-binding protein